MRRNIDRFLASQQRYFNGCYDEFRAFGGPCVYFHEQCLIAGQESFLSERHLEMLYATLTAWGMHRMGDPEKAKAKLMEWKDFRASIASQKEELQLFRRHRLIEMTESEYSSAILQIKPYYNDLKVSVSDATIVANSKALHHLFPELIPPIDRQYTIRFFSQPPEQWLGGNGKFKAIQLPKTRDDQFELFLSICIEMKRLADQIEPDLLRREHEQFRVAVPKALDNAIVNYVRVVASELRQARAAQPSPTL
jgi:hypothetical protein